jgi:hypothetical protein
MRGAIRARVRRPVHVPHIGTWSGTAWRDAPAGADQEKIVGPLYRMGDALGEFGVQPSATPRKRRLSVHCPRRFTDMCTAGSKVVRPTG